MTLFEELIEAESSLQGRILDALGPLLKGSADPIIGDTAFLIGRIRDPRKAAVLKGLLNHPIPEIVEIAREGLNSE